MRRNCDKGGGEPHQRSPSVYICRDSWKRENGLASQQQLSSCPPAKVVKNVDVTAKAMADVRPPTAPAASPPTHHPAAPSLNPCGTCLIYPRTSRAV